MLMKIWVLAYNSKWSFDLRTTSCSRTGDSTFRRKKRQLKNSSVTVNNYSCCGNSCQLKRQVAVNNYSCQFQRQVVRHSYQLLPLKPVVCTATSSITVTYSSCHHSCQWQVTVLRTSCHYSCKLTITAVVYCQQWLLPVSTTNTEASCQFQLTGQ